MPATHEFAAGFEGAIKKLSAGKVGAMASFYLAASPDGSTAGIVAKRTLKSEKNTTGKVGKELRKKLNVRKFARGVFVKTSVGVKMVFIGGNIGPKAVAKIVGKAMLSSAPGPVKSTLRGIEVHPRSALDDTTLLKAWGLRSPEDEEETSSTAPKTTETDEDTETEDVGENLLAQLEAEALDEDSLAQEYEEQLIETRSALKGKSQALTEARSLLLKTDPRNTRAVLAARQAVRLALIAYEEARIALVESRGIGDELVSEDGTTSPDLQDLGDVGRTLVRRFTRSEQPPELTSGDLLAPLPSKTVELVDIEFDGTTYPAPFIKKYASDLIYTNDQDEDFATDKYPMGRIVELRARAQDLYLDTKALQEEGLEAGQQRNKARGLVRETIASIANELKAAMEGDPVLVFTPATLGALRSALRRVHTEIDSTRNLDLTLESDSTGLFTEEDGEFDDLFRDTISDSGELVSLIDAITKITKAVSKEIKGLTTYLKADATSPEKFYLWHKDGMPTLLAHKSFDNREVMGLLRGEGYTRSAGMFFWEQQPDSNVFVYAGDVPAGLIYGHILRFGGMARYAGPNFKLYLKASQVSMFSSPEKRAQAKEELMARTADMVQESFRSIRERSTEHNETIDLLREPRIQEARGRFIKAHNRPPDPDEQKKIEDTIRDELKVEKLSGGAALLADPVMGPTFIQLCRKEFSIENVMFATALVPALQPLRRSLPELIPMLGTSGLDRCVWIYENMVAPNSPFEINISFKARSECTARYNRYQDGDESAMSTSPIREFSACHSGIMSTLNDTIMRFKNQVPEMRMELKF